MVRVLTVALLCAGVFLLPCVAAATCAEKTERDAMNGWIDAQKRLEAADQRVKQAHAVKAAAVAELVDSNDQPAAVKKVREAAESLRKASEDQYEARIKTDAAFRALECVQEVKTWQWSILARGRAAAAAGSVGLAGGTIEFDRRSSLYFRQRFGAGYVVVNNLSFNPESQARLETTDGYALAEYILAFKRVNFGAAVAYRTRVDDAGQNEDTLAQNLKLLGHLGVDTFFITPSQCNGACFLAAGQLFIQPWFSADRVTPTAVLFGMEFSLGIADGPLVSD